jgi:hypothetical protein
MIERRSFDRLPADDRGWLKARYHFSCAAPDDPSPDGWGCLRGWSDEEIAARAVAGWDLHPLESAAFSRRTPGTDFSLPAARRSASLHR